LNVQFLPENFTAILFHYDGNVNGWNDMPWSKSVIHIAASNQTKWYNISSFALRLGMLFSLFCNKKGHISTFHFFFWYHLASRQDDKAFISIGGLQRGSSIPLLSPCISTSFFGMKIWKWITSTQEGIVLHESNLLNLSLPSSKQ